MLKISHSSASMARSCPKKYWWHYIKGLIPIRKSNALALGSVVHEAFDMYYNKFPNQEVVKYIIDTMNDQIANVTPDEQEDLTIAKYTALGMWEYFPNKNLAEWDEYRSEKEFEVRLGNMRNVKFVGRSDRLLKKDGKWWIGELKTSGLPFSSFQNRAQVSDQVTAYVYAWQQLGVPVQGVIFDFIKKPLLRKHVKDTASDFAKRILEDYRTRPDFYFARHYEYRSATDVSIWLEDIKSQVKEIRDIWKGKVRRNPDNCWNYNAECPYKKICFQEKADTLTVSLYFTKKQVIIGNPGLGQTTAKPTGV